MCSLIRQLGCLENNGKCISAIKETLYDLTSQQELCEYWNYRHQVMNTTFDEIAWNSVGRAMQATPIGRRHWITKLATTCCGVISTLVKWRQKIHQHDPVAINTKPPHMVCSDANIMRLDRYGPQLCNSWTNDLIISKLILLFAQN
jgi:hypothetical protein